VGITVIMRYSAVYPISACVRPVRLKSKECAGRFNELVRIAAWTC
jgi:hypothetical protein